MWKYLLLALALTSSVQVRLYLITHLQHLRYFLDARSHLHVRLLLQYSIYISSSPPLWPLLFFAYVFLLGQPICHPLQDSRTSSVISHQ